ncbi:MAG: hypothetical protein K2Z80_37510 [Xanthobacteraceae bacterium]|nr:hypothetical protein [Xanthobacteraceae bacterium]
MTFDDEPIEGDARGPLMRKIRTEGVELAYETAVSICRDPKAPAPAKATALTALFRVAGYFEKTDADDDKEPHEMSAAELDAKIRRLRDKARARASGVFD